MPTMYLEILVATVLLIAHVPLAVFAIRAWEKGQPPLCIYLVGVSALLYWDASICYEALGGKYENQLFNPFFSSSEWTLILSTAVAAFSPWIICAGYWLIGRRKTHRPSRRMLRLKSPKTFYFAATAISLAVATYSISNLLNFGSIWVARAVVGAAMGPLVVLLFVPLGILCFYILMPEAHSAKGKAFCCLLVVCASLSVLVLGERTGVLLPFLIVGLFYGRASLKRIVVSGLVLLIFAALVLPLFKWQSAGATSVEEVLSSAFSGDVARGPILEKSVDLAGATTSRILPYWGSGYVYVLFYYVPRSIAPFKGTSTGTWFTAAALDSKDDEIGWSLGVGCIEELLLNFGWLGLVPGLLLIGAAFRLIDSLTVRVPVIGIMAVLAGIWFCGYNLGALVNVFGSIGIFGAGSQFLFAKDLTN